MLSLREKELHFSTLNGLLRACEGKRVQIDLRNELHVQGKLESVFGDMNVSMSKAIVLPPTFNADNVKSSRFYEEMTIRGCNIRFVHLPDDLDVVYSLKRIANPPNVKKLDK